MLFRSLALLELQGTINIPPPASSAPSTLVGKLVFPLYDPELNGPDDTKWMKKVYFYVGENQRLSGEVKRLGKPFAVIRRVESGGDEGGEDVVMGGDGEGGVGEELEIVDIVKYKAVFATRPEPVSAGPEEG